MAEGNLQLWKLFPYQLWTLAKPAVLEAALCDMILLAPGFTKYRRT